MIVDKRLDKLAAFLDAKMEEQQVDRMSLLHAVSCAEIVLGVRADTARDYVKMLVARGRFRTDGVNLRKALKEHETAF